MSDRDVACEVCDGTGCPCARWRDWWSMDYCDCGCDECGLKPEEPADRVTASANPQDTK